jgi:hypothetical protein
MPPKNTSEMLKKQGRPKHHYSASTYKVLFGRVFGYAENRALRGFRRNAWP